jgi:hypothetical protein
MDTDGQKNARGDKEKWPRQNTKNAENGQTSNIELWTSNLELRQEVFDYVSAYVGEAEITAAVAVGEFGVVQAHQM